MTAQIQAVRGMNDVLPADIGLWQRLESAARELLEAYGYAEMRTPVLEQTDLFKRAIGEHTDVVEKEMFTFTDQGGESLTLRPEATAGFVRAVIGNGMLRGQRHKLWCIGPMFRHEKPQKGRFRQFHQLDVEAIGFPGPDVDVELIALNARLWRRLGITRVTLEINSLGTPESRREYRAQLTEYLRAREGELDADSRRRLGTNPLRILDSKNPEMQALIAAAPLLPEHLDADSRAHFAELRAALDDLGLAYRVNPRLVRGLDYYSRTVFEWVTDALGSQNAVCSGGRYDGLIAQLGGEPTPAIGFALGIERVVELMREGASAAETAPPDVYVIAHGARASRAGLKLVEALRDALPQYRFELGLGGGNFKAQFRRADRSGASLALVVGEAELDRGTAALKPLRRESGQSDCPVAELPARIAAALETETAATQMEGSGG
ncbi:MAG TPA: histidine--tRNA ligase [Steroidobacteraceae bacterium]|nr:histidine--tRNA ligase [Steroidobacteraceae bacterium]